jgi:hypothetical protein
MAEGIPTPFASALTTCHSPGEKDGGAIAMYCHGTPRHLNTRGKIGQSLAPYGFISHGYQTVFRSADRTTFRLLIAVDTGARLKL